MSNAIRLVLAVAGVGVLLWVSGSPPVAEAAPAYTVSGPYTHDNLSVFLLHGPDTLPPRPVKTLDEALADGSAVVHETGTVNTLCVENLSSDNDLMMQNGSILKGGKQDRVLQVAMILPPKSGQVAVPAFCVEQGRWTGRGQEAAEKFATNPGLIAGKDLKNAVNTAGAQPDVWRNVQAQQAALSDKVGKAVNGAASPTSLQLALEDKELQAKLAGYRAALANALAGKQRVIGYAVAVNGKVTGAEVFGSGTLLAKAWPKAIAAAAVEALADKQAGKTFAAANEDTVQMFLADAGRREEMRPGRADGLTRDNAGLVTDQETTIEVARQRPITLSAPRVTEEPIGNPDANVAGVPQQANPFTPIYFPRRADTPTENVISAGTRLDAPGLGATGDGGTVNPTIANPVLGGRTASTRERMVTGSGGSQGQPQRAENALRQLAGNQFNRWQISHRVDVTGNGGRGRAEVEEAMPAQQPRPAVVQAPPVNVNRTAGKNGVMVESRDRANPGVVIHRTFIAK